MFRRPPRRPRRPIRAGRRPGHRHPQHAPKELIQAHQLMEAGEYKRAAQAFEKIARLAESRDGPRAPKLYIQAGHASILAGEKEAGLANLKYGLTLLINRADWEHLHRAGYRAVDELKQRGLTTEAEQISELLETVDHTMCFK